MHQEILTLVVSALPDIIRLGALSTVNVPQVQESTIWLIPRHEKKKKTNIKCLSSENNVRKSDILHPINYLEKNSFLYDYESGCSNVATWKGAGIYLCHDVSHLPNILFYWSQDV